MSERRGFRPSRREAVAGLAAAAVISWIGAPSRAYASLDRLRAGGRLTLTCTTAESFRVELPGVAPWHLPAAGGRATLTLPHLPGPDEWTPVTCTPLRRGQPCGDAVVVKLLTAPIRYGM